MITLLPSETKKDVCVTIKEDLTLEEREIFYCSLSISQESEGIAQVTISQAIVTIEDNDGKHKVSMCTWLFY
jgi:ferredoxin-thioredoxin reductase catalytic subunit